MIDHSSLITHHSSVPFYITGGTLSRDALSYVIRQADDDLYAELTRGSFCYVLTSRQMGKSSLMVRTAARLRDSGAGVVLLDLTAIGQNLTAEQWYSGLLTQIGQQLELDDELEEFWEAHPKLGPLQRWMQAIHRVLLPRYLHHGGPVVIFVDEIDAVRSLPFSTDEFFAAIREFYNRRTEDEELRRLTFCLLGVAAPSDLIRDTGTTPFNVGRRIELHDFTEAEAAPLVEGLRQSAEAAGLLNRILYWTNGHPYLTQRLCQAVAEVTREATTDEVDRLCRELFLTHQAQERDDNLLFVRERLLRSDVDLAGLLTLYAGALTRKRVLDDITNPLITTLRLSGITRTENGLIIVRNRVYERVFGREWVKENMPDAELRRQRDAYRRGLLRATAVAGGILAIIAALAFAALTQRNRAKAEATRADQNFQQANRNAGEARKNQSEAERQRQIAEEQRQAALNQRQMAEEQRDLAREQERSNRRLLYAAQMNLAGQAWEDAGITRMTELLQNQIPKPGQAAQEDLRGFEWNYLWNLGASELRSFRHDARVLSFFPDNKRLVTGDGRVIKIWDIVTGQQLVALSGHSDRVWSVAISPDGKSLASGSQDQMVKLWNALTGREVATLKGHTAGVAAIAFSPDGMKLATASYDKSVKLWDLAVGREIATLAHPDILNWVAISPDGKTVATACADRNARLWDASSGKELHTLKGHISTVSTLAFSSDGATLITAAYLDDPSVRFWDVASGKAIMISTLKGDQQPSPKMIRSSNSVMSVSFSPGGETIAVASYDRTVKLYSTTNLQLMKTFKGHGLLVDRVAFSPNGKLLGTCGRDGVVKLWDQAVDQETVFQPGDLFVNGLAFSPDGCCLATAGRSSLAKLWDVKTQTEMKSFRGHTDGILDVAYSPDGRHIVTASRDKTARLWDVATGKEIRSFKGHTGFLTCVEVSPDGRRVATGSADRTARLWDIRSGQELASFKGHGAGVVSLAFSADGRRLATAVNDGVVKLWDALTFREGATFKHPARIYHVAFSTDGGSLATACEDGLVRLWNLSTGKESLTLKGHHSAPVCLAFFPDGRRLATGGADNTVKLWNLETRQEMLSVRHNAQIRDLAVSADGRKLASAAASQVKLWLAGDPASATNLKIERLRELTLARKTPERKAPAATPPGWFLHGVTPDRYETGIDYSTRHSGTASAFIRSIKPPPTAHASILQEIGVDAYRGMRVRLSGYLKTERVSQYAGLWMRVDGAGYALNYDNMQNRPIRGTTDWQRYEIVLDVPEESFLLAFGFELVSEGRVWADDFELEIVGPDVPANGQAGFGERQRNEFMRLPEESRRLTEQKKMTRVYSLPKKASTMNFEGSN